jgi:hypothetical protein
MEKINFSKGFAKILLGFFIVHTGGNIYFAISGKFPPKPTLSIMPHLTPLINIISIILGLIVMGILIYLLYFRKNSDKFVGKDVLGMIAGSFFIGVLKGAATINFFVILISVFLILFFAYFSLKNTNK